MPQQNIGNGTNYRTTNFTKMILIAYGTRPEWIKIKPIIDLLDEKKLLYTLLFTGQHTTLINEKYDRKIVISDGPNRLDAIFGSILGNDWIFNGIDRVMVQGDTASAFAVALAAFNRKIPVVHLEAGLRSHDNDNPYPEELYRTCISRIAILHFCPTKDNYENLMEERIKGEIHIVGNTSIDSIMSYRDKVSTGGGCLITLHRRENQSIMNQWLIALNVLAMKYSPMPFVFVTHPNYNVTKHGPSENLTIIPAVSHDKMMDMIARADILISDSGGIQEEASFLHKPVIVCRKATERPEAIGITSFMCSEPENLQGLFRIIKTTGISTSSKCPFGDGQAAEKIVKILYD